MRLGMRSPTLRTGAGDVHVRAARRTYSGSNPLGAFCGLGRGLVRSDSSAHTSPCRALRRTCPSGRRGHPWCGSTRGRGRVATFRAAPAGSRCSRCSRRRRGPLRNGATGPQRLARAAIAQQPWCSACGTTHDLTADHLTPLALGGDPLGPLLVLCRRCNSRRGSRCTIEEIAYICYLLRLTAGSDLLGRCALLVEE
jgi:5-methylcytosine-specific restriction endonuclease McrA